MRDSQADCIARRVCSVRAFVAGDALQIRVRVCNMFKPAVLKHLCYWYKFLSFPSKYKKMEKIRGHIVLKTKEERNKTPFDLLSDYSNCTYQNPFGSINLHIDLSYEFLSSL